MPCMTLLDPCPTSTLFFVNRPQDGPGHQWPAVDHETSKVIQKSTFSLFWPPLQLGVVMWLCSKWQFDDGFSGKAFLFLINESCSLHNLYPFFLPRTEMQHLELQPPFVTMRQKHKEDSQHDRKVKHKTGKGWIPEVPVDSWAQN